MSDHAEAASRGRWGSSIGFILASAGAAVGLGNIQRFPYVVAQHGGGAFVLLYLFCVILLALPLMLVEFALGRHTQRNPMCAIDAIRPKSMWKVAGLLGILTAFFILSYYMVVGGWTLRFIVGMVLGAPPVLSEFTASPVPVFSYMTFFVLLVAYVVSKGVKKGIERYSKVFMPLLLLLLLLLVIRAVTLPGAEVGLEYYIKPDFSKLNTTSFIFALSQAFFSLCIGEAVLVTYGSYSSKRENLFSSALYISLFDTIVALVAGFIIFPALFAFQHSGDGGIGLTFDILPSVFQSMPFGAVFGTSFFVLLAFAALTTGIALLEIPVIYLIDAWGWSRKKAVIGVTIAAYVCGIPSALSSGISPFLSELSIPHLHLHGFYEIMDFLWGGLGMVIGGGLLALFTGWVWGVKEASKELRFGSNQFSWYEPIWHFSVKYLAPVLIACILVFMLF